MTIKTQSVPKDMRYQIIVFDIDRNLASFIYAKDEKEMREKCKEYYIDKKYKVSIIKLY